MSLRQVLTIYNAERQLTDDETALLNTLRRMNDNERQMFVEGLSGKMGARKKKDADAKKRSLEHCGICDYTRRAVHHKDKDHKDYHEFHTRTERPPKSQRASSIQQQIQGTTRTVTGKPTLCTYSIDGKICHGTESDGIHDGTMSYMNYHEFQPAEQAASASGGD